MHTVFELAYVYLHQSNSGAFLFHVVSLILYSLHCSESPYCTPVILVDLLELLNTKELHEMNGVSKSLVLPHISWEMT